MGRVGVVVVGWGGRGASGRSGAPARGTFAGRAPAAPMLGSAHPKAALMTYWKLGTEGMVAVEYLRNVSALKKGAYFLFAPVKIKGCHGGPGRAIALY